MTPTALLPEAPLRTGLPPLRIVPPHVAGRHFGYAQYAPTTSIVIPAMNEAENLPHVLRRLPSSVDEVILVDGNSDDDTVAVAHREYPGIRVVTQTGRGKGDALAAGFAAARGQIIIMLDADGSTDPAEIPLFVEALVTGADLAKGTRFDRGGQSEDITRVRAFGNRLLRTAVNLLYGVRHTDLCYGYMAFWRRCLPDLNIDCDGFEVETLITVRAARARLDVSEVPSVERPRIHGESNLRTWRDGRRVLSTLVRERFRRRCRAEARVLAPVTGLSELTATEPVRS
jgi:glycosyltransferase involved in cell wall biosynthesis